MASPNSSHMASEYYVAHLLSKVGYIVTMTLGRTKEMDIIVTNKAGISRTIDVKGVKSSSPSAFWAMGSKGKRDQRYKRGNHYFALVAWPRPYSEAPSVPELYLVRSTLVGEKLQSWFKGKGHRLPISSVRRYKVGDEPGTSSISQLLRIRI